MSEYIKPTVEQIEDLALIGVSSTAERNALRRRMDGTDFYALDKVHEDYEVDETEQTIRHTLGMRLGQIGLSATGAADMWRLNYVDGYHMPDGSRTNTAHTFEWTKESAVTAVRHSYVVDRLGDTRVKLPLDHVAPDLSVIDTRDSRRNLELEVDYTQVTAAECDLLREDLRQYYDLLRSKPVR